MKDMRCVAIECDENATTAANIEVAGAATATATATNVWLVMYGFPCLKLQQHRISNYTCARLNHRYACRTKKKMHTQTQMHRHIWLKFVWVYCCMRKCVSAKCKAQLHKSISTIYSYQSCCCWIRFDIVECLANHILFVYLCGFVLITVTMCRYVFECNVISIENFYVQKS